MKPREVKRQGGSHNGRVTGDGPGIGRVSRLRGPDTGLDGMQRRRRRKRGSEAGNPMAKTWSLILGGVALLVMGVAVFMWLKPLLRRAPARAPAATMADEIQGRIRSKFPSPSREEAIRLVKEALANRDVAQVERLFRKGISTPEEIVAFCTDLEPRDGAVEGFDWLSSLDSNGLLVEGLVVNHKMTDRPTFQRLALLTPDAEGRWRLDFDAFARTVRPSWSELLQGGADSGVVRVMTAPDVYYNGPFVDEAVWKCYAMSSPDNDELLRGYCRLGTREAELMERMFVDGTKSTRATLRIRRVPGGERKQFEITGVLGTDWIIAGEDGDS